MRLKDRVAVVTGGGRGIGRAIALAFAREGAAVVVAARSRDEVERVAREIEDAGGRARGVSVDVSRSADVAGLAETALSAFGAVEILVNGAGVHRIAPLAELDEATWTQIIDVNLHGPFRCIKAVLPGMLERNWGRIINVSSVLGKIGAPFTAAYTASKHGLIGLTRALAWELGRTGITVNAICPGLVDTAMTRETIPARVRLFGAPSVEAMRERMLQAVPQQRMLEPEEIAPLAVYLASPEAGAVTGQAYNVDAGMVMG